MKEIGIRLIANLFPAFVLFAVITFILWRKQLGLLKSVLFSSFSVLTIWVNAPLFIDANAIQNSTFSSLLSFPFYIYSQIGGGIVYIILTNVILCIASHYADSFLNRKYYTHKEVKRKYDNFVEDAARLYVIGRDIDFLDKDDYKSQADRIKSLRDSCSLLCEKTDDIKLLKLYKRVVEDSRVGIRFYQKDKSITNLKGQIKIDQRGNKKALFMSKEGTKYIVIEMEHHFLVQAILDRYIQVYEQAEPVR